MKVPDNLLYTKEHEWIRIDGSEAVVGITEFAQSELGEIVFVETPEPGNSIARGDTLCVVESTKAASDVYAPVSGVVLEGNSDLADTPGLLNSDPYDGGWLVKLTEIATGDVEKLLTPEQYRAMVEG